MSESPHPLRIALAHLAPVPGQVDANRRLVEQAIRTAAASGAQWILTPECCVCGYTFMDQIGTDWILPQPDPWMNGLCELIARLNVTVFLSHPERDEQSGLLHNSVFVIGPDGAILGRHRKINALKIGSESWSTPGVSAEPVTVPPIGPVGLLICADAYTPAICKALSDRGARLLVSSAAWAPGFHGPETIWENATRITGLPLLVCNRTGPDRIMDFSKAESVVAHGGRRLLSFQSETSALVLLDWDPQAPDRLDHEPRIISL
jgi:predicted amidohydrolase